MSLSYHEYIIIDATQQVLTIDMQFQKIMPLGVAHRPATLTEIFGDDAYLIPDDIAFISELDNAVLARDYAWWSNVLRKVESGRYIIEDHRGIDVPEYRIIVYKLDDDDDSKDNDILLDFAKNSRNYINLVNTKTMEQSDMARNTCELCDHTQLTDCRACDLSGEPNPESFTRAELVAALITHHSTLPAGNPQNV